MVIRKLRFSVFVLILFLSSFTLAENNSCFNIKASSKQNVLKIFNELNDDAIKCLEDSTNPDDLYILGLLHTTGKIEKKNASILGENLIKLAAEKGVLRAQFSYATILMNNNELKQAEYWFSKAASEGEVSSQATLGSIYLLQEGGYSQGKYWLEKASQNRDPIASYNLGMLYYIENNIIEGVDYFIKSAEDGFNPAQFYLGNFYREQFIDEIPRDDEKAFYWMSRAAEDGDALSVNNLAEFYIDGIGTEQDSQKAFQLFQQVSDLNECYGKYNLAQAYLQGIGVDKDEEKAINWLANIEDDLNLNLNEPHIRENASLFSKEILHQLPLCLPKDSPVYLVP